jgi:murein tripeptide amidase MpaA
MTLVLRRAGLMVAVLTSIAVHPLAAQGVPGGGPTREALLPPELPWNGRSRELLVSATDPWITPSEKSGLLRTPSYDETVEWLKRLVAKAPELRLISLGKSAEGRDVWMVVAARGVRAFSPEALKASGKPILLAQGGIHAGEIDGKDAGLMLLRDITVRGTKKALLDSAHFLFIPILNVDGHERSSAFARINQRGPAEQGWRTNARNLNLNRDYAKLDASETRAVVGAINTWQPDLYLDLHVTDGIDYQYDITFGGMTRGASPAIGKWIESVLTPAVSTDLEGMGHIPGPLAAANPVDPFDLRKGIVDAAAGPRFSTSYGDARHLATILVENHSLKPYPQRVLGTYVLLDSTLRVLGHEARSLRAAVASDQPRRARPVPVAFAAEKEPALIKFKGIDFTVEQSTISGGRKVVWSGRPAEMELPLIRFEVTQTVALPAAYWVPVAWGDVIQRLALHGIRMEKIPAPRDVDVTLYRLSQPKVAAAPFEGRVAVTATTTPEKHRERYAKGSVRVPTDQPLGDLAAMLLEPASGDSFFQWGFFDEVLQPTEYVEAYIMEPMAERMLAADPTLRAEYEKRVSEDAGFSANAAARLQWFYERTPFYDPHALLYPVGREE